MSVEIFKAALKDIWQHGEIEAWPYRNVILQKEILQKYYIDYNTAIKDAYLNNYQIDIGPTAIIRSFDILVKAMKYSLKDENRLLVCNVLNLLTKLKNRDVLNLSGGNLIYKPEKVFSSYQTATNVNTEIVHRIIALLKSYIELLYFRSYEISQEIHGPYVFASLKLIVWHYRNLKPENLVDTDCLLPYHSITVELFYNDTVDIKLDLYNHIYQRGQNLKNNFKIGTVFIDKEIASENELIELESLVASKISKLYVRCKLLDDTGYIQTYLSTLWYKLSLISSSVNLYQVYNYDLTTISISEDISVIDQRIINLLF